MREQVKCQFTTKYWNYEIQKEIAYICDSEEEDVLDSRLCIFHEKRYLEGFGFQASFEREVAKREEIVTERLIQKINDSIANQKALFCIGYHLPDNITIKGGFTKPVYLSETKFQRIDFASAKFSGETDFGGAKFSGEAYFGGAEFSGETDFGGAEFSEAHFDSAKFSRRADFRKTQFSRLVDFTSAEFSGLVDFTSAEFSGEARFLSAEFYGEAHFDSAKFSGGADFYSAKFSGLVDFTSAEFSEKADFRTAEFPGEVNFLFAKFSGPADFTSAKFSENANFRSSEFSEKADFYSAKFSEKADFASAKFSGLVDFTSAEFSVNAWFGSTEIEKANFEVTEFSGKAYFRFAKFSGEADFFSAKFSGEAYFGNAKFSGLADFFSAKFSGEANFVSAKFSGQVNFLLAEFSVKATFDSAKFSEVNFGSAKFSGEADFGSAKFSEKVNFGSAKFSGEANFSSTFKDKAYFNYVLFEDGKKILFGIEDLSKFSFMNTDMTRVRFSDRARWGEKDKFKIVEEEMLENSLLEKSPQQITDEGMLIESPEVSLGSVMAVYRNLRENYEYRLRYDEAGKFFIKEMELKRRYREQKNISGDSRINYNVVRNGRLRRNFSLTGVYYHLSRYGEDLLRPTLAGIVIVFLSTLFWLIQANPVHEPSLSHIVGFSQVGNHTQWYKSFERSLADLIPFLPSGNNVQIGLLDYAIKIAGGVLTFGLLAIALRRKFERKYTR